MFTTTTFANGEGEFVGSLSRGKKKATNCFNGWNILQPRKKSMSMLYCVAMLTFGGSNNSIIGFKMKKRKQRQMYSFYKNCILHKWTMSSMIFYAIFIHIDLVCSSSAWSLDRFSQYPYIHIYFDHMIFKDSRLL